MLKVKNDWSCHFFLLLQRLFYLGCEATVKKVKGIRLTEAVEPLITKSVMDDQVTLFTHKRRAEPAAGVPPKRQCLVTGHRRAAAEFNRDLNVAYGEQGTSACLTMSMDAPTCGPCNCAACSTKSSVTLPQVRFDKKRLEGHVETTSLYKEYRLVVGKRWAWPGETKTWPFGYQH